MKKRHAFTLIEMLVVIAIIGIVAAMVVNGIGLANTAKKNAVVNAQKNALMLAIQSYQAKLNYYPPDNGALANNNWTTPAVYDALAATNPLIYELTGATNLPNGFIQFFDGSSNVTQTVFSNMFGRLSINNANTDEPHNFFVPGPRPKDYTNYFVGSLLKGLLVPVPLTPTDPPTSYNFWHYDSSSTNRHNINSFDLWAEYTSATKGGSNIITTNGNW